MSTTRGIPQACPPISTPWPITIIDANHLYKENEAPPRFLKRMRITNQKSSLMNFVTVKKNKSTVTTEQREHAAQQRSDYVESPQYCESCNIRTIFNAREATVCCPRCARSKDHNPQDLSYREGASLHTPVSFLCFVYHKQSCTAQHHSLFFVLCLLFFVRARSVSYSKQYLYKQANHFRDHLKRVQGRESTEIPTEILEQVYAELDKKGRDRSRVTPEDIRLILKLLGCSHLYSHKVRIWSLATGKAPPTMSTTQENELMHLFQLLMAPWDKVRPKGRSNMLSYEYILQKFCLMLGYTELASHFKVLKSRDKLRAQDQMWQALCKELNFDFIRSTIN